MFIIKWKKGLESLNIKEDPPTDEEDEDFDISKAETVKPKITRALKKLGYGKYQTYANFLDGEEKEQYEQYLKNKRDLAKKRLKELKDRENELEIEKQPTEIDGMKSLKAQLTNLAGFGGTQKGP